MNGMDIRGVSWISDEWDGYRGIGWMYEVSKRD